jgi:hypothetical protein
LPAFVTANERALRSGDARTKTQLFERKVDITLDTDVYVQTDLPDEMLELDIADFGMQVLDPIVAGVGRKIDDKLAARITGASYQNEISFDHSTQTPYKNLAVPARMYLNNAYVPASGRCLVLGSELEQDILTDDQFIRADHIGNGANETVREGVIGRIAGFDVFGSDTCPVIPADEGYAFHMTAYALTLHAPAVPKGAQGGWSAQATSDGMSMRVLRFFDQTSWADAMGVDTWLGTAIVPDEGHYDADPDAGGKFVPVTDPDDPITGESDAWANDESRLVRAVKITRS